MNELLFNADSVEQFTSNMSDIEYRT